MQTALPQAEAPELGMARLPGGVEDHIGPAAAEVNPFRLVDEFVQVPGEDDPVLLQVHDVQQQVVRRIAVGQERVAAPDDAALPDVDARVQARHVQHVVIGQMDFAVRVGIGEAGETELLEQFVVAVAAPVRVNESVLRIQAPVDGPSVIRARVEDLLDDPAAFQRDVGHVAAVGPAAGSDVEQGELGFPRSLLHTEACIVAVRGVPLQLEVVHQLLLFHVEDADMPLVVQHEGIAPVHGETLRGTGHFGFRRGPVGKITDEFGFERRLESRLVELRPAGDRCPGERQDEEKLFHGLKLLFSPEKSVS